ncbi:MAG TPA: DNA polymerase III subunit delta [Candidatus Dojkabacteria bacterium]|nr:DNA polymerase III subunit delta [Candidatus Dojkabacteria bacterium]
MTISLLHGTNYTLVSKKLEEWVSIYSTENKGSEVKYISGSEIDISDLPTLFLNSSLFVTKKCIIIKDCSNLEQEVRDWFIKFLDNVKHDVLFFDYSKLPSNTKLYKKIASVGKVILIEEPGKKDVFAWTKSQFDEFGIECNDDTVNLFIERQGADPSAIANEIEKLILLNKTKVNSDDVYKYTMQTVSASMWDMIRYLEYGKREYAMNELMKLFETRVDGFYIFNMIVREYRLLFLVKSMLAENYSESQIAKSAQIHPFVVSNLARSEISLTRISKMYEKLVNIDFQVKHSYIDIQTSLVLFFKIV